MWSAAAGTTRIFRKCGYKVIGVIRSQRTGKPDILMGKHCKRGGKTSLTTLKAENQLITPFCRLYGILAGIRQHFTKLGGDLLTAGFYQYKLLIAL